LGQKLPDCIRTAKNLPGDLPRGHPLRVCLEALERLLALRLVGVGRAADAGQGLRRLELAYDEIPRKLVLAALTFSYGGKSTTRMINFLAVKKIAGRTVLQRLAWIALDGEGARRRRETSFGRIPDGPRARLADRLVKLREVRARMLQSAAEGTKRHRAGQSAEALDAGALAAERSAAERPCGSLARPAASAQRGGNPWDAPQREPKREPNAVDEAHDHWESALRATVPTWAATDPDRALLSADAVEAAWEAVGEEHALTLLEELRDMLGSAELTALLKTVMPVLYEPILASLTRSEVGLKATVRGLLDDFETAVAEAKEHRTEAFCGSSSRSGASRSARPAAAQTARGAELEGGALGDPDIFRRHRARCERRARSIVGRAVQLLQTVLRVEHREAAAEALKEAAQLARSRGRRRGPGGPRGAAAPPPVVRLPLWHRIFGWIGTFASQTAVDPRRALTRMRSLPPAQSRMLLAELAPLLPTCCRARTLEVDALVLEHAQTEFGAEYVPGLLRSLGPERQPFMALMLSDFDPESLVQ
jgi:hypothetical protein